MRFANPLFLLLLIPVAAAVWYFIEREKRKKAAIMFSDFRLFKGLGNFSSNKRQILLGLRTLGLIFLVLALARPQSGLKTEEISTKGIDIILCMDTSGSMKAEDFKPNNRLGVAKSVASDFVKGRSNDRIGIVVFSAVSLLQCPLTSDYGAVIDFMKSIDIGMTQTDGTAIGNALATSVDRLKDSKAKSKIIILLTDGRNNMGEVDPVTAAKLATAFNIKIYTIGVGKEGEAPFPVDDPMFGKRYVYIKEDLDEVTLKAIAETTEGMYFRATSAEALKEIYKQINKMEKTEIKGIEYTEYTDHYISLLIIALLLFVAEVILDNTVLRKLP
ncbi:MAG: aerotolerance regulator BatA [Candidatus Firestonebacteria bacterium RIFOXYC2_FULL_39_67]|nr:MAG: aerotolerance regulator BatA [Candidatus Firestonebacteria bacterium RIFOXYD2_FULL_39_29]OGF56403.1 MAG: aerotolerance regulator BatA [Candidatus Firestonebacteria bacterium RIFOXYC2_FULL_39_67]